MRRYRLTEQADRDLDEIVDWLLGESVPAALHVRTTLDEAFDRIARTPGIGHRREN